MEAGCQIVCTTVCSQIPGKGVPPTAEVPFEDGDGHAVDCPKAKPAALLPVIAVVLFALLITYLLFSPAQNEPTAQVTYGSLASSHFTEQLPLGIVLDRRRAIPMSGEGELVGRISFL
jgi:hypothetical protein